MNYRTVKTNTYAQYKVGDKVQIIRQDIFHLKDITGKRRWGTITQIDGAYIYVRPRYKRWEVELYDCEIAPFTIDKPQI